MADSKISALTDGGNLQGTDQVAINRGGTSYRAVALQDGWIDDTAETWTYVSGSGGGTASFKISGVDVSAKYPVGTRIKLTQTTVKYFVVIAVVFSTDTTVTITAGSDYTLANAAISVNYHSYAENPQGYPGWFTFALTLTGFSGTPTTSLARFAVVGRTCFVEIGFTGTSNTTALTCTSMPVPCNAATAISGIGTATDAGTVQTNPARLSMGAASSTLTFGKTWAAFNTWTNSGTKAVLNATIFYEI